MSTIDLYWYDNYATGILLQTSGFIFQGQTYPDLFTVQASDGSESRELDFLGSGITQDASGNILSGTVNAIIEIDLTTDALLWYADGLSGSAVSIYNAALTATNQDELALIQAALVGNDSIIGSPGNDIISGLSGADTLTGGGGNDIFLDTKAGHSGDTITDLSVGDTIVFSDAALSSFSFSLSGNVLTYTGGSLTVDTTHVGTIVATAAASGGVQLALHYAAPEDFNGDGFSDAILRNADGQTIDWMGQPSGALSDNSAVFNVNPGTNWHVQGIGDFNGDGLGDVLWRSDSGAVVTFLGAPNGSFVGNVNFNLNPGLDWHVVGTGDFNGDGRDDLLWRSDNGTVVDLLGNENGSFIGNVNLNLNPGLDWHVEGTGDFNGDGRDDILWRNDAGLIVDLLGNADGSFKGNVNLNLNPGLDWHVVGTGDFNGDGRDDILWQNDAGRLIDLLGNADASFTGNTSFNLNPGVNGHVAGTGDYNGDGFADILWRSDSGAITDYLGQPDGSFTSNLGNFTANPGTSWTVEPEHSLF